MVFFTSKGQAFRAAEEISKRSLGFLFFGFFFGARRPSWCSGSSVGQRIWFDVWKGWENYAKLQLEQSVRYREH